MSTFVGPSLGIAVLGITGGGALLIGTLDMLRVSVRGLPLRASFLAAMLMSRSALAVVFVSPSPVAAIFMGCLSLGVAVLGITGGGALLIGTLDMLRVSVRAVVALSSAGIVPGWRTRALRAVFVGAVSASGLAGCQGLRWRR